MDTPLNDRASVSKDQILLAPFHILPSPCLAERQRSCEIIKMDSPRSSKSYRFRECLPSNRPSYVSLILVFICGVLWLKNEGTNDRLLALENRMQMLSPEGRADSGFRVNGEGTMPKPTANSAARPFKKVQTPFKKRLDFSSGKNRNHHWFTGFTIPIYYNWRNTVCCRPMVWNCLSNWIYKKDACSLGGWARALFIVDHCWLMSKT